jgi:hypothetical protein
MESSRMRKRVGTRRLRLSIRFRVSDQIVIIVQSKLKQQLVAKYKYLLKIIITCATFTYKLSYL